MIWESSVTREMPPWTADPRPSEELYDLSSDPYETVNLADSAGFASARDGLSSRLDRWMQETDDPLIHGEVPAPAGARVDPPYVPDPEASEGFRIWEPPNG